jgi:DNA-binding MarR family transcriptional regulator
MGLNSSYLFPDFMTIFYRGPIKVDVLGEKLGENEERILSLIIEDQKISIVDIAHRLSISTTAVENNIKKLKDKGLLERKGPRGPDGG